jgi:hypothetical protein
VAEAVEARTNGTGDAVQAINTGTGNGRAGYFQVSNATSTGTTLYSLNSGLGPAGYFTISNTSSTNTAFYARTSGLGAVANFQNTNASNTNPVVIISGAGSGPSLRVAGVTNVDVLEIEGGSDLSEAFDVAGEDVQPGMVAVIDPDRPGGLRVASAPYDRKVAGIIAGAGGVKTGMMMKQRDSIADGQYPVALTGRVYCLADATDAAIEPGDLLVTSATPGHAMKVTDHARSQGAILGKAMTGLALGEKGLVLVLVSLQ